MLTFRKATMADVPALEELYEKGRAAIATFGIDQWQNGYPAKADIVKDIAENILWVSEDTEVPGKIAQKQIASVFALLFNGEPTYDKIVGDDEIPVGQWLTGDTHNYAAIHRITVSPDFRGRGIAGQTMMFGVEKAKEAGKTSLRIDTHRGNLAMRGMLQKNGFTHCGTIFLQSGEKRVAYERVFGNVL